MSSLPAVPKKLEIKTIRNIDKLKIETNTSKLMLQSQHKFCAESKYLSGFKWYHFSLSFFKLSSTIKNNFKSYFIKFDSSLKFKGLINLSFYAIFHQNLSFHSNCLLTVLISFPSIIVSKSDYKISKYIIAWVVLVLY